MLTAFVKNSYIQPTSWQSAKFASKQMLWRTSSVDTAIMLQEDMLHDSEQLLRTVVRKNPRYVGERCKLHDKFEVGNLWRRF